MTEISSTDTTVPPFLGALPTHCQRDVNTLRQFVHSTISEDAPADAVSPHDFREVLLTGVTGFIGRYVLCDLLRRNVTLVVHCLIRADNIEHGRERLRAALQQSEIWDEVVASRVRVVVGDIGQARFGLSEAEFKDLCQRIDAVYHLAADLTLASSYLAIRKVNTFSIRNVLELCLRTRYKHVFYASSMGVFPEYFCDFSNEFSHSRINHHGQPDLASMKKTFPLGVIGYPWSKLVAEQSLLFAQLAGMPVAIFRLPQTGMSSMGFTQANDITVRLFWAIVDVEMMPEGFSFQKNNEPVDTLSQILTAISMNPERRFTIYHCCDSQPAYHDIELADFGCYFRKVSYGSFKRACQAREEKSPLHGHWVLLDHFAPYWFSANKVHSTLPICDRAVREDCPHSIQWPGLLTKYVRCGDWIRSHRQQWPYSMLESRLDFDCLIAQAECYAERKNVPFERAYPEWMLGGMQRLVQALNAPDARLLESKRGLVVYHLSHLLRNNAALADERRHYPEIEREEITCPIFIVGINRTGTTYLHRLLARDERFWTLREHELVTPVLPTGEYATVAGTAADHRLAYSEDLLEALGVFEAFAGIHHIELDEPEEDFPILNLAFATWASTVQYSVPDFARWLAATGSRNAYAYHRRIMQHFTWQRRQRQPECPGQWLFKMPFHLMELEILLKTYPDALFIQTHREPTQFMGSWNSLVERVRSLSSEPRPPHELGTEMLAFMSGMLDGAVDFRTIHPELEHRWIDVNYFDLIEDPFGVVRRIYQRFGWTLEQAALDAMEEWQFLQAEKRRTEKRHRYDLEDYGLTPETVNAAFKRYRDFLTTRDIRKSRS